jgi:Ca2+-binding RTX toxin-like protein
MATFTAGGIGVDFDILDLAPLASARVTDFASTAIQLSVSGITTQLFGSGFPATTSGPPAAGVITDIFVGADLGTIYSIRGLNLPAESFSGWVTAGDNAAAKAGIFAGPDSIVGSVFDDRLRGFAGADTISAGAGSDFADGGDGGDQVFGGAGNDTVVESTGANYLRGEDGDDYILGGSDFDDINGNQGADTASGGFGDDWVVGGKDNDVLFGDEGTDLVYGNLGDDTCDGGSGADTLRGGQGVDSLSGGSGADYVSGDRGDDTVAGGAGADIFHAFSDAGLDRVADFSVAEGDRVQLDAGTTYTVAQVDADTVITLSAGQVVLVGVSMTSLLSSSIFTG